MGNKAIELFEKSLPNELSKKNESSMELDYNNRCYKKYDLEFKGNSKGNSSKFHVVESPHPASHLWSSYVDSFGSPFKIIKESFPDIKWEHHH